MGGSAFFALRAPDGGAGTGGNPTPEPGPAAWYAGEGGLEGEVLGHVQAKGWDKLDARAAALAAVKSERAHQQMLGVPAEQLIRLPKDAGDTEAWGKVWSRLGRPQDDKGYDLSGVKTKDGADLDESFANFMRQTAFKLNLPKDAATELTRSFTNYLGDGDAAKQAERAAQLEEHRAALKQSWGGNYEANKLIAQNAFRAILPASGMKPEKFAEAMTALENVVGYDGLHQVLLTIGQKIGEDKFIGGRGPTGDGVMTREQAVARKAELMRDQDWTKKYLNGDTTAAREMTNLNRLISGVA